MMDVSPQSWSQVVGEVLPLSECDVCGPPRAIGPPPPIPANFQERVDFGDGCNLCDLLSDVEIRPTQLSDASLLPIVATLIVGILLIVVTLIVLFIKVKKCRAFLPYMFCWIFPRSMLPHTELAPSSLPSPSPSTEKLKGGKRRWHGSAHSLQSENIYEVCSPPSQDSLYEEVGPVLKSGICKSECSPYGVVLVEKSGSSAPNRNEGGSNTPRSWLVPGPSYTGSVYPTQQSVNRDEILPVSPFSTFTGSGRGFINPTIRDGSTSAPINSVKTSQPYRSMKNTLEIQDPRGRLATSLENENSFSTLQRRQLPPVPLETVNFSL